MQTLNISMTSSQPRLLLFYLVISSVANCGLVRLKQYLIPAAVVPVQPMNNETVFSSPLLDFTF